MYYYFGGRGGAGGGQPSKRRGGSMGKQLLDPMIKTKRYRYTCAGFLLAPAEGFGLRPRPKTRVKKGFLYSFVVLFGVQ